MATAAKKKPTKKSAKKSVRKSTKESTKVEQTRLWLMYPSRLIKTPVIWEVGSRFNLVPNVRQASVTDEIGIVCLELSGSRKNIQAGVKWMEELGVSVEPVEINVIES